ncbi:ferritin-like domain-containing protein [Pantoea ananatis]|uniref:ferritin-like domain-containing protein n=1 Tax=Pantoea ananas TaxID=553 RepID=UPI0007DAC37A|nr:DUF892 family protein [Pantoea ananatis]MBN6033046.1 ferritin-like domain-containing protein [Pantoea ananatis]UYL00215.1 DUF892 family protein [Pantoea ananatis]
MSTTSIHSHYHDWLRDAHAMEKQAETMLEQMANRLENYPQLRARIELHIEETRQQQAELETILDRHGISHSSVKDVMGKMAAMGQAFGGVFAEDEVIKGAVAGYVFENAKIGHYTSLINAATRVGDLESIPVLKQICEQELAMSDWMISHLPELTDQFLTFSEDPDTQAKR